MSDPMSGLGDVATGYLFKERKYASATSAEQVKVWGSDQYQPSSQSMRALGVVQQTVTETVSAVAEADSAQETKRFSQQDFSPEAVASRILGFVGNYIEKQQQQGADDERISSLLDLAQSSIEKGLGLAAEKLSSLNWLTQDVQTGIDDTTVRLNDGMTAMREAFLGTKEVAQTEAVTASYERSDAAELTLTTQEGDQVTLNMYALSSSAAGVAKVSQNGQQTMASFESTSSRFGFEFAVTGELNDKEQSAISDLVNSLGKTAELFFSGDVQGAMEQALRSGFNSEQLASFTMALQTDQTMKASQVQTAYSRGNGNKAVTEPLVDYRKALEQTMERASNILEDYRSSVADVMSNLSEMQQRQDEARARVADILDFNNKLIGKLSALIEAQTPPAAETSSS
jgi:hypothetical protein